MNQDVVVTIRHQDQTHDVSLPLAIPLAQLAPLVAEKLLLSGLTTTPAGMILTARLLPSGTVIEPHQTLETAQVSDGDSLELLLIHKPQTSTDLPHLKGSYLQSMATGRSFPCPGRSITIGRGNNNTINLSGLPHDDAVSRQHATITQRQNHYWIQDNSSTNGTFVNGVLLEKDSTIQLQHGSQLQFGKDGPQLTFYINS